tara:strand:+ start:48 stop:563 length:516 start_codon:yes stop_codon:yes gene_type:complete
MKYEFNVRIKDNFLEDSKFKVLYNKVPFYNYSHNNNSIKYVNHIWYSAEAPDDVAEYLKNQCEKEFNLKLKINFCSFTMLATVEPIVHCDYKENECSHQVIVYLRGNENLHKGTGFYTSKDNDHHELNTHVGFKQNRAIFWNSQVLHSPLNWSADDKSKRFSLIAQYQEIK